MRQHSIAQHAAATSNKSRVSRLQHDQAHDAATSTATTTTPPALNTRSPRDQQQESINLLELSGTQLTTPPATRKPRHLQHKKSHMPPTLSPSKEIDTHDDGQCIELIHINRIYMKANTQLKIVCICCPRNCHHHHRWHSLLHRVMRTRHSLGEYTDLILDLLLGSNQCVSDT